MLLSNKYLSHQTIYPVCISSELLLSLKFRLLQERSYSVHFIELFVLNNIVL